MKLQRNSVLPRLGEGQVINDIGNPIQLVTLTADNAWHDYDWAGYEIAILTSSPLIYAKVNFSNADDGIILVSGKRIRVPCGFSGCRVFLGHEDSLVGSPGTQVTFAISRLPIDFELSEPSEFSMSYHSGGSSPGASTVILDTGALAGGLYAIAHNCHTYIGAADTYRMQHRDATNANNKYEFVNSLSGSVDNVMMQKTIVMLLPNERFRIVTTTGSAIGFSAHFRLKRIG